MQEQFGFAWNHGDVTPDITNTWLGMVGPGVASLGLNNDTWSDHTDIRPTMMMLLGLKDDYSHDGRALIEDMNGWAIPAAAKKSGGFRALAPIYKEIEATVGPFGLDTLAASTKALASGSANDDTAYAALENELASLGDQRDALAAEMNGLLEGAEFAGQPITQQQVKTLKAQAQALLDQAKAASQ